MLKMRTENLFLHVRFISHFNQLPESEEKMSKLDNFSDVQNVVVFQFRVRSHKISTYTPAVVLCLGVSPYI